MSTITVRLFHHPSRTPIAELQGVDPGATLSSLRAMAERHLAAEEACMMRVFARWHIEVQLGARKAVVELTAQDEAASVSSLGIEDYSAVLLEGPLTGDFEGVGQGLALVAAQVRRLEEQNAEVKGILLRMANSLTQIAANTTEMCAGQRRIESISSLPCIENSARLSLNGEQRRSFALLSLQSAAVVGCLSIAGEEAKVRGELLATAHSDYQLLLPRFAIDTTTPQPNLKLEGPHTAVRTGDGWVTLRASQPLSEAKHRWAVRIHEGGSMSIWLGLLPKLSANKEAKMGHTTISRLGGMMGPIITYGLGGWAVLANGRVRGDWQCEPLPFGKGDLVLFDYSFADKTLTIRCGGKQVVGRIPNIKAGEELYPAITLYDAGMKVSFEHHTI